LRRTLDHPIVESHRAGTLSRGQDTRRIRRIVPASDR